MDQVKNMRRNYVQGRFRMSRIRWAVKHAVQNFYLKIFLSFHYQFEF